MRPMRDGTVTWQVRSGYLGLPTSGSASEHHHLLHRQLTDTTISSNNPINKRPTITISPGRMKSPSLSTVSRWCFTTWEACRSSVGQVNRKFSLRLGPPPENVDTFVIN